jgi:acetyl-CoA carboxylase carboxyltransferase component
MAGAVLVALRAPMAARVVELAAREGERVREAQVLVVVDAMKMEHVIAAPCAGRVRGLRVAEGDQVAEGQALLWIEPGEVAAPADATVGATASTTTSTTESAKADAPKPVGARPDLQRVLDRQARLLDDARPEAVARRRARGQRTARENVADLCDVGSFVEYGALAVAAQRSRRSLEDLIANTPADGMITGIGSVNGALFDASRARTVVLAYDATVLAGTQGMRNHAKTDRLLEIAHAERLPLVLFAEGGGGRPGDVDVPVVAGLHLRSFASFARLSGRAPVIGIVSGRCFAGNAALLGCCDVIIATRDANIGMGGPAMIEGGGLGVFRPEEIGPSAVQSANGVVDVLVDDEAAAVATAKRYLSMFQGRVAQWRSPDAPALRDVVPENRLRVYDTRAAMRGLVDADSLIELRAGFGVGIHTALARVEGQPIGLVANNPLHLAGAIDADAADKLARFLQLCDAHGLPIVSLIDTPGFMVGPDVEARAQVRHASRLFVVGAALRVPFFAVVLRKGYGLGAMAMAAGGFHSPNFTVAWPTGEFGAMGLEGAVRLGYRKELEAAPEGAEREALFERLVARHYERGEAMNMAEALEIDAVIDPACTREWIVKWLASTRPGGRLAGEQARFVDPW